MCLLLVVSCSSFLLFGEGSSLFVFALSVICSLVCVRCSSLVVGCCWLLVVGCLLVVACGLLVVC